MKYRNLWSIVNFIRSKTLSDPGYAQFPTPIREATIFRQVLEFLPIGIPSNDLLAGDFGWNWLNPDDAIRLEQQIEEKQSPSATGQQSADPIGILRDRFHCFGSYTTAHTCADYERVVNNGIVGILAEVSAEKAHATGDKWHLLDSMKIALDALVQWARRYAELAVKLAEHESNEEERNRLQKLASICRHVPLFPARNFHEAIQSIWFVHVATGISEYSDASLSLGRLDQYLYPFFRQDIEYGISESDLEFILVDLFRKLNRFGDPACAVNLGGVDEEGSDLFNPLSSMIIRVAKKLHQPSPLLVARIHERITDDVFDQIVDADLLAMGQPTYYGEFSCRKALIKRGVPSNEAYRWAANSCMGLIIPGEEISDMWGGVVNMLLPLELTLNKGCPFHHELPITFSTQSHAEYKAFDQLVDVFFSYMDEIVEFCIHQNQKSTHNIGQNRPNPFFSALIRDCISRGKDRSSGGPRYHTVIIEAFGLVNASDSLLAIQKIIFEEKRYSLDELVEAIKGNFDGFASLHQDILRVPKYGNNDQPADSMAHTLAKRFAYSVSRHTNENISYAPSFHTLNAHIAAGRKIGASLDGRLAGQPIAKNIGTVPGRNSKGHTAMMLSATAIDQSEFYGGQALDISIDLNTLNTDSDRKKFQSLLQTYFRLGGLQVQVNGISADILRLAMANPALYQDVIVKIAGYSARFVNLGRDVQQEMIERFESGL